MLFIHLFQLLDHRPFFSCRVVHIWIEEAADLLIVVLQTLEDQQLWDDEENFSVSLFDLLGELFVLFSRRLDYLGEMDELVTFFRVQEVREALTPAIFEFYKDFDQLDVVLELRIDYFDVLVVLAQQIFEVVKGFLNSFCQVSYGFTLRGTDPSENAFSCDEHFGSKVVSPHAFRISNRVDLT